ncbi:hypothetical protein [Chryseobacterium sp. SN22]|uniref:hypothetical protein n=1 Tax=Chryseobacterium sp. SN22 TaxID=2606431 RepID=UPI0016247D04|nr:hypothetical protein [Chryseobacterium sp. SN22]
MKKFAGLCIVISSFVAAQQKMLLLERGEAFQKNNLQLLTEQYNINNEIAFARSNKELARLRFSQPDYHNSKWYAQWQKSPAT